VKGDIHDIGKNLVDIILSNNGYKVHNIGINRSGQEIIDAILKLKPDSLGLSGLLVKSAWAMRELIEQMAERDISIPVFCGGAALTKEFVETEMQEIYKGSVYYSKDAFDAMNVMENDSDNSIAGTIPVSAEEHSINCDCCKSPERSEKTGVQARSSIPYVPLNRITDETVSFSDILPHINKKLLFKVRWEIGDVEEAEKLFDSMVRRVEKGDILSLKISYGFFKAGKDGDSLNVETPGKRYSFHFPRQSVSPHQSLTDYFRKKDDIAPFFIVTIGGKLSEECHRLLSEDLYSDYLFLHNFGIEVAEALAEYAHIKIRNLMNIGDSEGKRYSNGYTVWPDLEDQKKIAELLNAEKIGVKVSETCQLIPEHSISALVVHHPGARYFNVE